MEGVREDGGGSRLQGERPGVSHSHTTFLRQNAGVGAGGLPAPGR